MEGPTTVYLKAWPAHADGFPRDRYNHWGGENDILSPLRRDIAKLTQDNNGRLDSDLGISIRNYLYDRRPVKDRGELPGRALNALVDEWAKREGAKARPYLNRKTR